MKTKYRSMHWKPVIEIQQMFFLNFSLETIETLQNHFIFIFLILNLSFWQILSSLKKRLISFARLFSMRMASPRTSLLTAHSKGLNQYKPFYNLVEQPPFYVPS